MTQRRFRYLLPVIWGVGCVAGFQAPGDEYFLFAVGSIVGVWAGFLVSGDVQNVLVPVLVAGCVVMTGLGFVLDILRGSLKVWVPVWAGATVLLYSLSLAEFSSVEAAVAKNGSLGAYVICASQLAVYAATVVTLVAAAVRRYGAMLSEDLSRQRA